jgi:hypothetical protein
MKHFLKLYENKFVMWICSTTMQFSQPPLAVLPVILPHAGAITAEV